MYPYDASYKPITNVPIVSGATAYVDKDSGETYILVFHESLFYGKKLNHTLINPNQVRMNGVDYWDNPFNTRKGLCIETSCGLHIPLRMRGTKISFDTHLPSKHKLNNCPHINMTSVCKWDPGNVILGQTDVEYNEVSYSACIAWTYAPTSYSYDTEVVKYKYHDPTSDESILHQLNPSLVSMKELMVSAIHTDFEGVPARQTYVSKERHKKLTAKSISDLWCIGLKRARATIDATTQTGIRSAILPLSRRYRADH